MALYKNILIAVDASEEAMQVLRAAATLPGIDQAEGVTVLHVTENPSLAYGQWLVYLPFDEMELQEKLLDGMNERVARAGLGPVKSMVESGRPVQVIMDEARAQHADLIVLGSHGRHGVQLLVGSTANAILHHAECDTLLVRITPSAAESE